MRPLRIAQVAPLWFPVPPRQYGGIERVVALLTDELVNRGHEVTLFCAPGSATKARQVHVFDRSLTEAGFNWLENDWNLRNLSSCFETSKAGKFDIIHSHLDKLALFFQGLMETPVVHTMHGNLMAEDKIHMDANRFRLFSEERDRTNIVFISRQSRKTCDIAFPNSFVVPNAVDIDHFRFQSAANGHFIWIARIDPEKGLENAIAAAERAGITLLFAGRIDLKYRDYYDSKIRPHLGPKIQYVGELNQSDLPSFYGQAKAMIYPIEWEEPFGLVVAEAMACGTPVIAYRRGSMPELIEDGVSGYLTDPEIGALVQAMQKTDRLDRRKARRRAEEFFHPSRMAEEYEQVYAKILGMDVMPTSFKVPERRHETINPFFRNSSSAGRGRRARR